MQSFRDGSYFINDQNENEPLLRLELSFDDYLPANPLGLASGRQKLCAIYMTLNNLDYIDQCRNENIYI